MPRIPARCTLAVPANKLLAQQLRLLEIPDCDCAVEEKPACMFFSGSKGCDDLRRRGRCDHAPWRAPCPHVFHADDPFFDEPWAAELMDDGGVGAGAEVLRRLAARQRVAEPAEYAEPPACPVPMPCEQGAPRVTFMAARWGSNPDRPVFAIRDPDDWRKGEDKHLGVTPARRMNGSTAERGLKIYDPDAPPPEDPVWDDFALSWLARVNAVLARTEKARRAA